MWWIEDNINWRGLPFAPTTASKPGLFLLKVSLVTWFTSTDTVMIVIPTIIKNTLSKKFKGLDFRYKIDI